ncbi:hypothetical protein Tco_0157350 [Tanacetum coccineum]
MLPSLSRVSVLAAKYSIVIVIECYVTIVQALMTPEPHHYSYPESSLAPCVHKFNHSVCLSISETAAMKCMSTRSMFTLFVAGHKNRCATERREAQNRAHLFCLLERKWLNRGVACKSLSQNSIRQECDILQSAGLCARTFTVNSAANSKDERLEGDDRPREGPSDHTLRDGSKMWATLLSVAAIWVGSSPVRYTSRQLPMWVAWLSFELARLRISAVRSREESTKVASCKWRRGLDGRCGRRKKKLRIWRFGEREE